MRGYVTTGRLAGSLTLDESGLMVTLGTMVDNINKGATDTYNLTYEQVFALGMKQMKKIDTFIEPRMDELLPQRIDVFDPSGVHRPSPEVWDEIVG